MRMFIVAAISLASSHVPLAQEVVSPPVTPAPSASAPLNERTTWCDQYATWLVAMTPTPNASTDSQQAQHLQVELNACKIDPQDYERQTRAEADYAVEVASG